MSAHGQELQKLQRDLRAAVSAGVDSSKLHQLAAEIMLLRRLACLEH
jgi:coproporphyrinogen III oxidase-like Fe-S oxidoreductase